MGLSGFNFKNHRTQVIKDKEQYICLLDENGNHIIDLPDSTSIDAEDELLNPSNLTMTVPVRGEAGLVHPCVDYLISDNIGAVDEVGKLEPNTSATRLVLIERADERRVYRIAFCEALGDKDGIYALVINGVNLLDYLEALPCPSDLKSWKETIWKDIDRDWVKKFKTGNKQLAHVFFADVADGYTEFGPADKTIIRIINKSIEAVNTAFGWSWRDSHIMCSTEVTGNPSPDVYIRIDDRNILETVQPYALYANVNISCEFFLPGDSAPKGTPVVPTQPTIIVKVEQK